MPPRLGRYLVLDRLGHGGMVEALRVRSATAWAKLDVGQFKAVMQEAAGLREEAEALNYAPLLAGILRLEGVLTDNIGDYKAAEAALVRALITADAAGDDELRARIQLDLTLVVGLHQARFDEGVRFAELTRGTLSRLHDAGPLEGMVEGRLAEMALQRGEYDRAALHIGRSAELQRRIHGEASREYAHAVATRGTLQFFRGEFPGALGDYQEAVALYEDLYGAHHPILG